MKAYDINELINFREQPDGSVSIEPKPASPPPPCICGRGAFYHPWRFCDKYTPAHSGRGE